MKKSAVIFLLLCMLCCKDRYNPPVVSTNNSYLVVEGYINGSGVTTIRLSRTFKLADTAKVTVEANAQVRVESNGGASYTLVNRGAGIYELAQTNFNPAQQYRVRIVTTGNKEYMSDWVAYKATPVIDSVNWRRTGDGVQIYVNAHDDQNKTIYYRWDYDETWEYHSAYRTVLEYKNHVIVPRDPNINVFTCWQSQISSRILLGSSAKLVKDVISLSPVTAIPQGSWMLSVRYSIIVRQYALEEKAYQYWLNLQKNTESLGSIFDPLPSEISGNIHSTNNPTELVLGYISAGTIQNKRIFINNSDVTNWFYRDGCELLFTPNNRDSLEAYFGGGGYGPTEEAYLPSGAMGYNYSTLGCLDCRLRGTNVRPSFW